jgi:hypothetical protein
MLCTSVICSILTDPQSAPAFVGYSEDLPIDRFKFLEVVLDLSKEGEQRYCMFDIVTDQKQSDIAQCLSSSFSQPHV